MRVILFLIIPLLIWIVGSDIVVASELKKNIQKKTKLLKSLLIVHWIVCVFTLLSMISLFLFVRDTSSNKPIVYFMWVNACFFLFYIPKLIYVIFWSIQKLVNLFSKKKNDTSFSPSRREFISRTGMVVASIPFASIFYGLTIGRFAFTRYTATIKIPKLPDAFKGFKIIQLSDTHLGNFNYNYTKLEEVITLINEEKPDIIVHTGDLVNNFASELEGWDKVFSRLQANYGKYAVMGNHDYGHYAEWPTIEAEAENLRLIKKGFEDCGFQLLLNENKSINIGDDSINLLGVEDWGDPPFPKRGDLTKAIQSIAPEDAHKPKILLTHNPTHWQREVLYKSDIDLTLSGHTHGMQMGMTWNKKQWSPAQWGYKYWGGLYQEGSQYLYVNRGLGYVGVPMRVGMNPEISIITLS